MSTYVECFAEARIKGKDGWTNIDMFAKTSNCSIKEILNWLPILAASQSVKGIKKQSAFLNSLIFMSEEELEALYEEQ